MPNNTDITDYSVYLTDEFPKKLAANGCLLSHDRKFLLLQTGYECKPQELVHTNAPIQAVIHFAIQEFNGDKLVCTRNVFDAKGTPGQCYNYASTQFDHWLSTLVDESEKMD